MEHQGRLFDLSHPDVPVVAAQPKAPAQRHSATSQAAAAGIEHRLNELETTVMDAISGATDGLTDNEGVDKTGLDGSTYRPRRVRLVELGLVADSGRSRKTESGRMATVWVVVK